MYLMTCTRLDLAYPLSILARYVAPGRHRPEHMAAAKRVLRYLCMVRVHGTTSIVVTTGVSGAFVPRRLVRRRRVLVPSSLLVTRSKTRGQTRELCSGRTGTTDACLDLLELQQRGQLRLAYVASEANTADIFTKALAPVCFALLDWSCDPLFSPTLPMGVCQTYML
ncbi:unnamed protein product [Closterium sp. NIES-53]